MKTSAAALAAAILTLTPIAASADWLFSGFANPQPSGHELDRRYSRPSCGRPPLGHACARCEIRLLFHPRPHQQRVASGGGLLLKKRAGPS